MTIYLAAHPTLPYVAIRVLLSQASRAISTRTRSTRIRTSKVASSERSLSTRTKTSTKGRYE
eukprot:scaffold83544_cov15-Prasinocladus_malaysianus.AAC.1